jgi:predicted nucleic acid-binding protein
MKDRLQGLFDAYAFLQRCDGYDHGAVNFLLAERARLGVQDRGEVEAVVQAVQIGATVIVDDPWGRELAAGDDLEFHGTIWVLQQFHKLRLLTSAETRTCFESLLKRRIRLPWEAVNEFLASIGQDPLQTKS